jgi:ribosomal-protein-alanine N-acetyltransferase
MSMTGSVTASVQIRPARVADIAMLAQLEQQIFETVVYPEFFFRQAHDLWPDFLLLAWLDGHLVGYLLAAPGQQGVETIGILSLGVASQSRGYGVGKALLHYFLQHCPEHTRRLWLTVSPDNEAALRLYQQLGFYQEQYYPDYYGVGEHRLLLAKQFSE